MAKNEWKAVGALGGFIAGQEDELTQSKVEQSLMSTDLDMRRKAAELDVYERDRPVREAERKAKIAKAESSVRMTPAGLGTSGRWQKPR